MYSYLNMSTLYFVLNTLYSYWSGIIFFIILLIINCYELLCFENVELGGWMFSTIYVSFTKKSYTNIATDLRVPELRCVVQEGFE